MQKLWIHLFLCFSTYYITTQCMFKCTVCSMFVCRTATGSALSYLHSCKFTSPPKAYSYKVSRDSYHHRKTHYHFPMYSRISCTLFLTGRILLLTLQTYDSLIIFKKLKKKIATRTWHYPVDAKCIKKKAPCLPFLIVLACTLIDFVFLALHMLFFL